MMFGTSTKVLLPALDCSSIGCSPTWAFKPWFSWLSWVVEFALVSNSLRDDATKRPWG
jgi:hypothetical protein